jgi:hypothetical protein
MAVAVTTCTHSYGDQMKQYLRAALFVGMSAATFADATVTIAPTATATPLPLPALALVLPPAGAPARPDMAAAAPPVELPALADNLFSGDPGMMILVAVVMMLWIVSRRPQP